MRTLLNAANKDDLITTSTRSLPSLWMLDMLLLTNMLTLLLVCTAAVVCIRLSGGERALALVVFVLLAGCLLGALQMRWAEALTQIRWLFNDMGNNSWQGPDFLNVPRLLMQFPGVIHIGEVFFALLAPIATLISIKAGSILRRETFAVALTRGMRGGAVVFTTVLTVAYLCTLIVTARAEAQAGAVIDGMAHNGVDYLQQRAKSGYKP